MAVILFSRPSPQLVVVRVAVVLVVMAAPVAAVFWQPAALVLPAKAMQVAPDRTAMLVVAAVEREPPVPPPAGLVSAEMAALVLHRLFPARLFTMAAVAAAQAQEQQVAAGPEAAVKAALEVLPLEPLLEQQTLAVVVVVA